ncbi:chemotaxis protein CheW [Kovacikia minuta CCNUW1]|uniref:chemotaxis protein CheW n=1 Tax=Kovacikia minuta TaxID=2931930 RepID=UPI001CCBF7B9|nr:chemotaxis protein CheW [Kovacikia minuta]UBF24709.1 chemotaxis protein CheW [Kovacikia minuta CCNUW1]
MNNYLASSTFDSAKQRNHQQATQSLHLIVFDIGNLKLAVPIQFTYKVANYSSVHGSGLNHMGVTHVDNLEITVVDLHRRLFKSDQTDEFSPDNCLVIVQNSMGELCGVPSANAPTLMEVPLSMIRALPPSYRRSDTLDIASHVAVIPQASSTLTLFLLDVDQLLSSSLKLQ